ncbi:MAG: hypothetical protein ACLUOI_08685 [Eisenbergiella sp.]
MPLYALEIVGSTMETETRYERQGLYLTDVQIRDSRVHMTRMRKAGGDYEMVDEDTLVCNEEVIADPLAGIGYLADSVKGRLYFVQLNSQAAKSRTIRVHVPKKAVAEENNVISLTANHPISIRRYYAYSGRMNGSCRFAQAVKAAYDDGPCHRPRMDTYSGFGQTEVRETIKISRMKWLWSGVIWMNWHRE